jgi:hypothetical protein
LLHHDFCSLRNHPSTHRYSSYSVCGLGDHNCNPANHHGPPKFSCIHSVQSICQVRTMHHAPVDPLSLANYRQRCPTLRRHSCMAKQSTVAIDHQALLLHGHAIDHQALLLFSHVIDHQVLLLFSHVIDHQALLLFSHATSIDHQVYTCTHAHARTIVHLPSNRL